MLRRRHRRTGLSLWKSSSKARKSWRFLGVTLRAFCVHAENVRSTSELACGVGGLKGEGERAARSTTLPPLLPLLLQLDHLTDDERKDVIGTKIQSKGLCRSCWFVVEVGGGTTSHLKAQNTYFHDSIKKKAVAPTYINEGFLTGGIFSVWSLGHRSLKCERCRCNFPHFVVLLSISF